MRSKKPHYYYIFGAAEFFRSLQTTIVEMDGAAFWWTTAENTIKSYSYRQSAIIQNEVAGDYFWKSFRKR